jgi:predicted metalloprotease with PDZ domain
VLRELWASHGAVGRGYREADLIAAFARQAPDLAELLPAWLNDLEDPPLQAQLASVGLRLESKTRRAPDLGCRLEKGATGLMVQRVGRDGPAEQAGVAVGDEWLALNGVRLRSPDDVDQLLQAPGFFELLFCRDGLVRTTRLRPAEPVVESWSLVLDPDTASACAAARRQWLALEMA